MDVNALTQDYHKYEAEYETFQKEIATYITNLINKHDAIDIDEIRQRPHNKIKPLKSILDNISERKKYKGKTSLFDLKDVAGIRITCCCEDDYIQLTQIIEADLKFVFNNVVTETKGEEYDQLNHKKNSYRAIHFNLSKTINVEGKDRDIFGEIQLRTVMGNAWAILNRKYVYKVWKEGEPTELTIGTSAIMEGCEKIWSVVKRHKLSKILSPEVVSERTGLSLVTETQEIINQLTTPHKVPQMWLDKQISSAAQGLTSYNISGYMEIVSIPLSNPPHAFSKNELKDFARKSQIHTFGWPIAVYLDNRESALPVIDREGIHAEISVLDFEQEYGEKMKIYDYWAIHEKGSFYTKTSLFEDTRRENSIFFDTRIIRITEALMYVKNLYTYMKFPTDTLLKFTIQHGGLTGRDLRASGNRLMFQTYKYRSADSDFPTTSKFTLGQINTDIVSLVKNYTKPLFEMFNGFELDDKVLQDIVLNYVAGKVT